MVAEFQMLKRKAFVPEEFFQGCCVGNTGKQKVLAITKLFDFLCFRTIQCLKRTVPDL